MKALSMTLLFLLVTSIGCASVPEPEDNEFMEEDFKTLLSDICKDEPNYKRCMRDAI